MTNKRYQTFTGAHPSIQVNVLRTLPLARWLLALRRTLALIRGGTPLRADDSNDIGNKYTEASWGMCGNGKKQWPDAEDHIWPLEFESRGRVAPIGRPEGRRCPLDTRPEGETGGNGCFYSCRIFQGDPRQPIARQEAIDLYETRIAQVEREGNTRD